MAEFVENAVQLVESGQNVLLEDSIPCNKGYVLHRNGSGIITLRGIVNNPCARFARYHVAFNGNIAVPTGGTAGPIAVSIAVNGEPRPTSRAIVTPAAVEDYSNVTSTAIVTVPKGCCFSISVRAVSGLVDDEAGTAAPAINVTNSNLVITRVA